MKEPFGNIPIVGQPFAVLKMTPLVLMMCKCQAESGVMNLIQIFGFQNATACPKCGNLYTTTGIKQDGNGGIEAVVTYVRPVPTAQVM